VLVSTAADAIADQRNEASKISQSRAGHRSGRRELDPPAGAALASIEMAVVTRERGENIAQTEQRNQCGRAIAMTVVNPIKSRRSGVLRFNFWLSRRVPQLLNRLRKLSFIHFMRWTIVDEFPYNGPPQEKEDLNYKYLFFISNYNGYWMQYIDAFYHVVGDQMDWIWSNAHYYPKGQPPGATKRAIRHLEYTASHFYSATPEASATTIQSALALKSRFADFQARAAGLGPDAFEREYRSFLTGVQHYI
jgi:hypothetical protein